MDYTVMSQPYSMSGGLPANQTPMGFCPTCACTDHPGGQPPQRMFTEDRLRVLQELTRLEECLTQLSGHHREVAVQQQSIKESYMNLLAQLQATNPPPPPPPMPPPLPEPPEPSNACCRCIWIGCGEQPRESYTQIQQPPAPVYPWGGPGTIQAPPPPPPPAIDMNKLYDMEKHLKNLTQEVNKMSYEKEFVNWGNRLDNLKREIRRMNTEPRPVTLDNYGGCYKCGTEH